MKAPVTAYVIKDNNFYKTCLRKGGTDCLLYVARFLTSYSSAAEEMASRIMDIFRLDKLYYHGEKQADGSVKPIGFIGAVRFGGANAKYHAQKRMSGVRSNGGDGSVYEILNDAGLNTLPYIVISGVMSSFANCIHLTVRVESAFYEQTVVAPWEIRDTGDNVLTQVAGTTVPKAESVTLDLFYEDSTLNMDNPSIDSGQSVIIYVKGGNNEGDTVLRTALTTQPRVVWLPGRLAWRYSQQEPFYLYEMQEAQQVRADLWESHLERFATVDSLVGTVPLTPPVLYSGLYEDWPTMSEDHPRAEGWYFSPDLPELTSEDYNLRAWYADGMGRISRYKVLSTATTQIYIGAELMQDTDVPEGEPVTSIWRRLTVYARVQGQWHERPDVASIRVRVGLIGDPDEGPIAKLNALRLSHSSDKSDPMDYETNIGVVTIETFLTESSKEYTSLYEKLYYDKAQMEADGGQYYFSVPADARYVWLSDENAEIVCVLTDGTERAFRGTVHWDVNGVDASPTAPEELNL